MDSHLCGQDGRKSVNIGHGVAMVGVGLATDGALQRGAGAIQLAVGSQRVEDRGVSLGGKGGGQNGEVGIGGFSGKDSGQPFDIFCRVGVMQVGFEVQCGVHLLFRHEGVEGYPQCVVQATQVECFVCRVGMSGTIGVQGVGHAHYAVGNGRRVVFGAFGIQFAA